MPQSKLPESPDASFGDILSQFEQTHHARGETVDGTVVSVTPDGVFVDIGRKMDGVIPVDPARTLKKGDKLVVSIRGRDEEGTYLLSTVKVDTPRDWSGLEAAFAAKRTIGGTVIEGRTAGGRRRQSVHAGVEKRRARTGRDGKTRRRADRVPHHQARYRE
jgi:small subunit ribosomal protein S1